MAARPASATAATPHPGPGTYPSPPAASGPAWTIARRRHASTSSDVPGPGAYDPHGTPADTPAWTIAGRPRSSPEPDNPVGPADYDPPLGPTTPAWTMAGRPRAAAKSDATPGPGHFDPGVGDKFGRGAPAFTIGQRPGTGRVRSDGETVPDPGWYEVDRSTWRDGPAFTFAGQRVPSHPEPGTSALGPGRYDPTVPGQGPAFTFARASARPKEKAEAEGAGPGQDQHITFVAEGPAFTVPRGARCGGGGVCKSVMLAQQLPVRGLIVSHAASLAGRSRAARTARPDLGHTATRTSSPRRPPSRWGAGRGRAQPRRPEPLCRTCRANGPRRDPRTPWRGPAEQRGSPRPRVLALGPTRPKVTARA